MRWPIVIAAMGLVMETAVAGAAQRSASHSSRVPHASHRRAGKHHGHKVTPGGAHREGPVQVRPDGTVVPNGLTPRVLPVPEILKKKGPPQG